jgi:hypothetical protein
VSGHPTPLVPTRFRRRGRLIGFGAERGSAINGDPCVVWDDDEAAWRMVYFALPPGHAQALNRGDPAAASDWEDAGPLVFTNAESLPDGIAFKPFIVLEPAGGNRAARIDGRYCLLVVTGFDRRAVRRAWAPRLAGPWTLEVEPILAPGDAGAYDGKHVEAPSAYWLADAGEMLVFYMATPAAPQSRAVSPLGSCQAAARVGRGESRARRLGPILVPDARPGHWAAGWVGGLQLVERRGAGWLALVNAGSTPPRAGDTAITRDEPPPSVGGFAFTDDPDPTRGWRFAAEPIERVEEIPAAAIAGGEGTNLWRHHWLACPDGRRLILYNSGPYAAEQLFAKEVEGWPVGDG